MKFITQESQVTLQLEGMERVWALRRRLQIPRFAISEIRYEPELPVMQDFSGQLRIVGTALPLAFVAGTFRRGDDREFLYVRFKQPGILTIVLKPDTLNYDRVRVTCTEAIAQTLTEWWRAPSGTRGEMRA
jgi:hypothetical protein